MLSEARRNFMTPNFVFGVCLVVIGGTLIMDRLGMVEAARVFRFWPLALVLYGSSLVVQAMIGGDEPADRMGYRRSGPGPFIFLLLLGLASSQGWRGSQTLGRIDSANTVDLWAVLGMDKRISDATDFHGAKMTGFMGRTDLDLRQASIAPGQEAIIDVYTLMGGAVLRVPPGWTVDVQTVPIMGGVSDRRGVSEDDQNGRRRRDHDTSSAPPAAASRDSATVPNAAIPSNSATAPRLVVRGSIIMGGLTIRS